MHHHIQAAFSAPERQDWRMAGVSSQGDTIWLRPLVVDLSGNNGNDGTLTAEPD